MRQYHKKKRRFHSYCKNFKTYKPEGTCSRISSKYTEIWLSLFKFLRVNSHSGNLAGTRKAEKGNTKGKDGIMLGVWSALFTFLLGSLNYFTWGYTAELCKLKE